MGFDEGVVGEERRGRGVVKEELGIGEKGRGGWEGEEELQEFAWRKGVERERGG